VTAGNGGSVCCYYGFVSYGLMSKIIDAVLVTIVNGKQAILMVDDRVTPR